MCFIVIFSGTFLLPAYNHGKGCVRVCARSREQAAAHSEMLRCWVGRRQLPALGPECSAAVDKSPPRGGKRTETARGARVCAVFTAQTAYLWLQLRCETRLLHTPRRSPECQGNL